MRYAHLLAAAAAAPATLMAGPSAAQNASLTVHVRGFVAPRCGASFAGDTSFTGTIDLSELVQSAGAASILPSISGGDSPTGFADVSVGCSGARFNVSLSVSARADPPFPSTLPVNGAIDREASADPGTLIVTLAASI